MKSDGISSRSMITTKAAASASRIPGRFTCTGTKDTK